jgi:dTDP-4-dehydrorhamnose 3,5-epimerase
MRIVKTDIQDLLIIEHKIFDDNRGWFFESYSKKKFQEVGIQRYFVQDNHSYSSQKSVLRGLHFQINPKAQTKLVRCTQGKIQDVVVDLRMNSPTYKKWFSIELSAENKKQLLIPKGFAHGFLTLTDNAEVQYKTDEYYSPEHDAGIIWSDQSIGVDWNIKNPILSKKDANLPLLKDSKANF